MREDDLVGKKFVGVVMDADDPSHWARVRVMIRELFDGYATADLPWFTVVQPIGRGAGGPAGALYVPRVGTRVLVDFDAGDKSSGFVIGEVVDRNSRRTPLEGDYPKTYGFIDEGGTLFKVNTQTGVLTVEHKGTKIEIGSGGALTVESPGSMDFVAGGNVTITAPGIDLN